MILHVYTENLAV